MKKQLSQMYPPEEEDARYCRESQEIIIHAVAVCLTMDKNIHSFCLLSYNDREVGGMCNCESASNIRTVLAMIEQISFDKYVLNNCWQQSEKGYTQLLLLL